MQVITKNTASRLLNQIPSRESNENTSRSPANGEVCHKAVSSEKRIFCELLITRALFGLPPLDTMHPGMPVMASLFLLGCSSDGLIILIFTKLFTNLNHRTHAYAPPHLEGAYPGISMPSMLPHDSHMAHMGMPPPGHLPGYPMHPFMVPQYM
jgi:hypothetical protein